MDPNSPKPVPLPPIKSSSGNQLKKSTDTSHFDDLPAIEEPGGNIFVSKPPEKKPASKRSIWVAIGATVAIIVVFIVIAISALIVSAAGLASDYRGLAFSQMKKIDNSLIDIDPSKVINLRNLEDPAQKIKLNQASQPRLESVLSAGDLSPDYIATTKLQNRVEAHYKEISQYTTDISTMLSFDDQLNTIFLSEPALLATAKPDDAIAIRAISGSYENIAEQIKNQKAPNEIKSIKEQVLKAYKTKAAVYLELAAATEQKDTVGIAKAQQELDSLAGAVPLMVEDTDYIKAFQLTYDNLLNEHKKLKSDLNT